jgi:hypothetical protein
MTAIFFLLAGAAINSLVMLWVERGFHFGDEPRAAR